ncbi:DUF1217 domain-containing protein [Roseomonas sp. GC11]|uniref:DUF1217 domain-containing protein n=1 Tax=Roseomonas sp. GC11 TaxID=2950546 RepID=UPI0021092A3C|nr:DUF1217 domain-containing protein [Roseomonas sp. GC11]MCQ4161982.1 DUF1217 domain-containing protein [Roseomonas sp. GC11]
MAINPYMVTLFGGSVSDSSTLTGSQRISLYNQTLRNEEKDTVRLSKDATVTRNLDALQKAIDEAETPEDLLKDPTARAVLLQSLGLAGEEDNTGLAIKALMSDTSADGNLASQLSNTAWETAAEKLDFANSGLDNLRDADFFAEIKANYIDYQRLSEVSDQSRAVSDALHVSEMEDETPNVYNILADKVLRRVALTLTGLPDEIAYLDIEDQARQVESKLDLSQFSTAEGREKLIQRYLIMTEDDTTSSSTASSYLVSLFA